MCVYNTEKYVTAAIESILAQTFGDFELLIVDDGSTDKSLEVISRYTDRRLVLIRNEQNMGKVYSLNSMLVRARGEFLAIMDSDDISLPQRLEKQIALMDGKPDLAACGTWCRTFGRGKSFVRRDLVEPEDIKARLLFNSAFLHSSAFIRVAVLQKHKLKYRIRQASNAYCEDYDLWSRLAQCGPLANIPRVLVLYRLHPTSMSVVHRLPTQEAATLIRKEQLTRLGLSPSKKEMEIHNSVRMKKGESIEVFLREKEAWLFKILEANELTDTYDPVSLNKILSERWRTVCSLNSSCGILVWKIYRRSSFSRMEFGNVQGHWPLLRRTLLFLRCALRQ